MIASNPSRRLAPRFAAACLVFVILAGCSADRSVFESTPFRPARVEVIDTLNRETVWSMDVPINQKLVIDMERSGASNIEGFTTSSKTAETMKWWLYRADASKRFATGYYWGNALDEGVVEIDSEAIMLRYSIIPREDDVPVGTPPASAPPAPRPAEPRDAETDEMDESPAADEPMDTQGEPAMDEAADEPAEEAADEDAPAEDTGEMSK
ncbi:MAG: hypothetical protein ACOC1G_05895 [Phycisphaeraceae bacterium]